MSWWRNIDEGKKVNYFIILFGLITCIGLILFNKCDGTKKIKKQNYEQTLHPRTEFR